MTGKTAVRFWCLALLVFSSLPLGSPGRADSIYMKNGIVYRSMGQPDKDGTLVYMWDGLRKLVVRDSKIEKIVGDNSYRTGERFQLVQPLLKYAGVMPKEVISVQAGPWNERGQRTFRYVGSRSNKPISMEQAIIEIGPHLVKFRGIDEFWQGALATSEIPRPVIMSLLSRVEQQNQAERERALRFLMDAGWYPEAKQELERVMHDFPNTDLSERAKGARAFLVQAEATGRRSEIEVRKNAHQFRHVDALLKSFTEREIGTELVVEVRELSRRLDDQHAADLGLATDLRKLESKLPAAARAAWKKRVAEAMKAIEEAPDAVRDRFAAWRKAAYNPGSTDESKFALAMSGFVAGSESAIPDLPVADLLWQARDLVREYLLSADTGEREALVAKLDALDWPAEGEVSEGYKKLDLVSRMVQLMPPPASGQVQAQPESAKSILHKVIEEQNDEPTEYAVRLPPEYHPLRSYPAVVALHSGKGPESAIEFWAPEAARRGYIVIAPEYNLPRQPADYGYSSSEHAAVELALRDARRRYAIDSDHVFLAGQLTGGNMAWDFALAHPDLFAGVIVVSGFPAKYVPRYLPHHERLPLFVVLGDLAPAANEIIFGTYIKPLILKAWDVTYVEYHRRGLEEFPEEITTFFDWMDRHHREPFPKLFDAVTARPCDNRFYGVVIREHSQNRTTAPEAVEMLGQNLSPARLKMRSSTLSNLLNIKAEGVKKLDVWVSPKLIDFKRKMEIRINSDKPFFRGQVKLSLEPLLEDLRVRGDRQQLYWYKVTAG